MPLFGILNVNIRNINAYLAFHMPKVFYEIGNGKFKLKYQNSAFKRQHLAFMKLTLGFEWDLWTSGKKNSLKEVYILTYLFLSVLLILWKTFSSFLLNMFLILSFLIKCFQFIFTEIKNQ